MKFSRVALIGFGEVGQTLGADLVAAGCRISAFDPLFADPASRAVAGSSPHWRCRHGVAGPRDP